jgi:hypothetical protein
MLISLPRRIGGRPTEEFPHDLVLFGMLTVTTMEPALRMRDVLKDQRPARKISQNVFLSRPALGNGAKC